MKLNMNFEFIMNAKYERNVDELWIWWEFNVIELLLQWVKANVRIVSEVIINQRIWIAYNSWN
jgi:hypothetical protein